jgi:hypothetical protein
MALALSACALVNGDLNAEFVVNRTFIGVSKAPSLKRVLSDSDIRYCRYGENSSKCSLADAETASNITDDDRLTLTETSSTGKDAETESTVNDETASEVTVLDNDCFDWIETASWVTDYDFDEASPSSSFPPAATGFEMDAGSATNLDMQAAHLKAQAQKMEEVALFVRQAAQFKAQARDAEESALLARRAALLQAQIQEAEAAARLARCKAQALWLQANGQQPNSETSQMTVAADFTQQAVPVQPITTDYMPQMVWCPVFPTSACPSEVTEVAVVPCPERSEVTSAHRATAHQHQQKEPNTGPTHEFTTLMLRNIPNSYSRNMLLELLDKEGFSGDYDLVYVPVDFGRLAGLGYAFVNLTTNDAAERARQTFQGFNRWNNTSQKVCEVSWSGPLQGLSSHIEHYRNSPVMHESVPECYKPALFQGGLRRPFPCPTKEIRAPRVKRGGFPIK